MDVPGTLDFKFIKYQAAVDANIVVNKNSAGAGSYRQGAVAVGGVIEYFVECNGAAIRRQRDICCQRNRRFVDRDSGAGIGRFDVGAEADRTGCCIVEAHGAGGSDLLIQVSNAAVSDGDRAT